MIGLGSVSQAGPPAREEFIAGYRGYLFVKILIVVALVAVLVIVAGYAITIGSKDIGILETYRYLWNHIIGTSYEYKSEDWFNDYIICEIRSPRVIGAILAGFGLAVCGCVMQAVTRNPLADPYTTGMSSGSVFGVSVGLVFGFTLGSSYGDMGLMFNAFVFGLIPAIFIIAISNGRTRSPATIVLGGIAIMYFFNSLSTLVMMFATESTIKSAYLWQLGTLERIDFGMLPLMAIGVVVCSAVMYAFSKQLNLLNLGNGSASTLGLDVSTFRAIMIILSSVMTATIVSFTGIIGFVGLVAPHVMRQLVSSDNRYLIPSAGLLGAVFLLVCDTICRSSVLPTDLPVGVIMSFIGAPIFLYIIIRSRRHAFR